MFYFWHVFLEFRVFSFWVWYILLTVVSTFCLLELMECNLCVSLSMYVQFIQECFQRLIWLIAVGDILWMKDPEYVHSSCMHLWSCVVSSGNSILTFGSSVIPHESCNWMWNYSMCQNRAKSKSYLWLTKTCTIKKHVELEILGHAVVYECHLFIYLFYFICLLMSIPVGGEHLASSLATLPLENMVLYAFYKWLVP